MPSENLVTARPAGIPESRIFAWCALTYVACALGVDTLAVHEIEFLVHWEMFRLDGGDVVRWLHQYGGVWADMAEALKSLRLANFDLFKFFVWFVIPVGVCFPWMDWGAWGFRRWKRVDYLLLVVLGFGSIGLALAVPFIPGVNEAYQQNVPLHLRTEAFVGYMVWCASWLPGWEFLHRYFLLRALRYLEIKYEWLIVPAVETLYHLPKLTLEIGGMFVYGFLATAWTKRRDNWLLPFLVHLAIEVAIVSFMVGWLG